MIWKYTERFSKIFTFRPLAFSLILYHGILKPDINMKKTILINEIVRCPRLDNLWKETYIKGFLSFIEALKLSQLTSVHLAKLLRSREIPYYIEDDKKLIDWQDFFNWYSSRTILPDNSFGRSSYSIDGLIELTGKSRCWVLEFASRYEIHSELLGKFRRFDKIQCELAWKVEQRFLYGWISLPEARSMFIINDRKFMYLAATKRIKATYKDNAVVMYCINDIDSSFKRRAWYEQGRGQI